MAKEPKKLIANNKKVYHDYFLLEKYEAGISLAGTEVKSLRMGKGSIKESFIRIENGEIILYGMHITPYEKGNIFNKDPLRPKKLLLHKKEIDMVVNIPKNLTAGELSNGYKIRRAAIDLNIPLITNARLASAFINAFCTMSVDDLRIKSWAEYK